LEWRVGPGKGKGTLELGHEGLDWELALGGNERNEFKKVVCERDGMQSDLGLWSLFETQLMDSKVHSELGMKRGGD
jgi:hypothetical protein